MSAAEFANKPWIPDDEKRAKYEADGRVACGINPLNGVFTDHSTRDNYRKDGKYNVVTLAVEGVGDVDVHCAPTVLASQMLEAKPNFGEEVTIAFLGMVQGRDSSVQPYASYKVKVKREVGGSPQWAGNVPDEPVRTVYEQPAPPAPAPADAPSDPVAASQVDDDGIPF